MTKSTQPSSNKAHKFQNVVTLSGGRRLIVDPRSNDASSINARVVANLDVKATNNPTLEQRLIYDDEEAWTAADLNLLQGGAPSIPFSRSAGSHQENCKWLTQIRSCTHKSGDSGLMACQGGASFEFYLTIFGVFSPGGAIENTNHVFQPDDRF
jgi:hypothetical protein